MEVKPEQLAAQLAADPARAGPFRPAFLIAGPEPLRVLEAADAVRAAARRHGIAEREVFEAEGSQREPDWEALESTFRAPSLFASRRLVEVRLPTGKPGKEGAQVICDFCAQPPADVTLRSPPANGASSTAASGARPSAASAWWRSPGR